MASISSNELSDANSQSRSLRQFNVSFVTKDNRFAVASTPYNVFGSTTCRQLNALINTLIFESNDRQIASDDIEFDFLIDGKLLRFTIEEFVESEHLSYETQLQIEFIAKEKPPKPYNSLLHDDWVSCVDSFDNWIVSGCYDSTVHIWSLSDEGRHKIAIPAHTASVTDVQWLRLNTRHTDANDYMFVSSSHDESAIVWKWNSDTNQVEYIFACRGHQRSVNCLDVYNQLIATGSYDQLLKIWSLDEERDGSDSEPKASTSKQTKKQKKNDGSANSEDKNRVPIITMSGHKESITGCVWMADDSSADVVKVATISMDNTIKLWDIEVAENIQTLTSGKALLSLSYSQLNGSLITGSCDRHIRLFDPRSSEGSIVKSIFSSHQSWVSSVRWSTTNQYQFISGSYDNIVKQWDIRSTNSPLYDLIGHEDKVLCVNWSSPQHIISGAADNQLKIFSLDKN